jgi:prepilin-type N-terminal cleavage/methylation domain-containing protein
MNKSLRERGGFTLLEILLVVAIISILAGIVIVAINPAKQLGDARNAQRRADVATILSAVYQYVIDNNGSFPANINPVAATYVSASTTCADYVSNAADNEICKSTATTCSLSNLNSSLASSTGAAYVTSLPVDPNATSTADGTSYYIAKITPSNRILVCAPKTENKILDGGSVDGMIGASR